MPSAAEDRGQTLWIPRKRGLLERAMDSNTRILEASTIEVKDADVPEERLPKIDALADYQREPEKFIVDKLGVPYRTLKWSLNPGYEAHLWDGTPDPLIAMMHALADWQDTAVEAATGTQKSYTAACLLLWFNASFDRSRVFTFAPKEEQLRSFIWMEIGNLWGRFQLLFPTAVLSDLRIQMRGKGDKAWGARGYAVGVKAGEESATNAQGMHAEHMMLIYEECPGIPVPVITAGEMTCTAPHNIRLALGNPDHQLDGLHLFGHDEFGVPREGCANIRISALDHPNIVSRDHTIVPGAASAESVKKKRVKFGPEHRMYKSRVRGMSPAEAATALIKLDWVQRAQKRWEDEQTREILEAVGKGRMALGVDVANSDDGDEAAISHWKGAVCLEVPSFPCNNSNNLGYQVFLKAREYNIDPEHVGVDPVGVGAGTLNELNNRDFWARKLSGGADGSVDEEEWNTLRSQMWWTLAEDLRLDRIALPKDVQLAMELIQPTWKAPNDKIIVESKEVIKARTPGRRSPNKADAVVYGNYVRPRDPVVAEPPKRRPTLQEEIYKELQQLDDANKPKRSYGPVMRQ